jgi:hypothetical protein
MSNARNLADIVTGNFDVPLGALDNIDLSSRVAKSGDTMTGNLIVDANVGIGTTTPTSGYKLNVGSTSAVLSLEGAAVTLFTSGGLTSNTGGVLNFRPQLGTTINDIFNLSVCAYDHSGDGNADGLSINGADGVSFSTGGNSRNERMRIDSAGRVTMPYQPAFNVASTASMAFQNVWTYNTTHVNIGGHMNISNGRFTAPVAGTYVFFFGTIGQTTHSDSDIYLQKNGTNTKAGVARPDNSGAWASMGAGTGIMTLSAGDYIAVYSSPGNSYSDSNNWLHFRGYLLG